MPESRHRTTVQVDVDDRAVRQLGQEIERAIDPAHMEAFERAVERSNRAIERLTRATERMTRASTQMSRAASVSARSQPGFAGRTASTAVGTMLGRGPVGGRLQRFAQAAGGPAGGEGFLAGMFDMIPYAGPVLGAAVRGAQQYYAQYIAAQTSRMQGFGVSGIAGTGPTLGRDLLGLGYGPAQQAQVLGNMAQMSGRRGAGLAQIAAPAAMMERFMGVNPAALFQGSEIQGQIEDPVAFMQEAIGSLREMGFRDPELTSAVQQLSSVIGEMQTRGIYLDPRSMVALMRGLGAARLPGGIPLPGLTGQAGAGFAQRITQMGGNLGQGASAFDYLMLRAAGGGRGGNRTLMQARVFGERQGGQVFFNLMDDLMSRVHSEGDREALGFFLAENMGIPADLAMQLASMDSDQIASMREAAGDAQIGRGQLTDFLQEQMGVARGPAAAVAREAGLEAQRVGIGGRVADSVQQIQDAEIALVQQFMPAALSLVTGTMRGARELIDAYDEGGVAGVLAKIAEMTTAFVEQAGRLVGRAAGQAFEGIGDLVGEVLGQDDPLTMTVRNLGRSLMGGGEGEAAPTGGAGRGAAGGGAAEGAQGASGGGAPGTEPGGGLGPISDARAALRAAERHLGRLEGSMGLGDGDLEAVG